jgi:hypothetical protein
MFNGYKPIFPGVRRPERESGHSHPSIAKVKNEWSYTSAPTPCVPSRIGLGKMYMYLYK